MITINISSDNPANHVPVLEISADGYSSQVMLPIVLSPFPWILPDAALCRSGGSKPPTTPSHTRYLKSGNIEYAMQFGRVRQPKTNPKQIYSQTLVTRLFPVYLAVYNVAVDGYGEEAWIYRPKRQPFEDLWLLRFF